MAFARAAKTADIAPGTIREVALGGKTHRACQCGRQVPCHRRRVRPPGRSAGRRFAGRLHRNLPLARMGI